MRKSTVAAIAFMTMLISVSTAPAESTERGARCEKVADYVRSIPGDKFLQLGPVVECEKLDEPKDRYQGLWWLRGGDTARDSCWYSMRVRLYLEGGKIHADVQAWSGDINGDCEEG